MGGSHNIEETENLRRWKLQDIHALSIGNLCITWAVLDRCVDDLFKPLLKCSDAQVASIATNIENISSRCEILKRLLTIEAPSPAYRTWLSALLDRVSGELAPLRNRYVHDCWSIDHNEAVKINKQAKISKAQSHQPDQLLFDTRDVIPAEDVDKLAGRVTLVLAMLASAAFDLRRWRQTGRHLEPHPQYIEASKRNARYRSPQEHAEAVKQGPLTSDYVFD